MTEARERIFVYCWGKIHYGNVRDATGDLRYVSVLYENLMEIDLYLDLVAATYNGDKHQS